MKRIFFSLIMAALTLTSCSGGDKSLKINTSLSRAQKKNGIFTPEVMWKMGRIGEVSLSSDVSTLLFSTTYYNLEENRGITSIYTQLIGSEKAKKLTDNKFSASQPQWSGDSKKIYFLTSRSGEPQVWVMDANGKSQRQVTDVKGGVEGFGVSPKDDRLFYVAKVQVAKRKSSEIYSDMPHSKARVYDDLMVRHWDKWDDGVHSHIFVAELKNGVAERGHDIIGTDAAYDAPLAPYFSMSEISWNHAGTKLAYTCKPKTGRDYATSTDSDIYIYDVATRRTTNLCKDLKHDEPLAGYDKYPVFSPYGNRIAFVSQRRDGNEADKQRLMVYDFESEKLTDLTKNFDYNASDVVWCNNSELYFVAPIEATHQLCKANIEGKIGVVTSGDHDITSLDIVNGRAVATITTLSKGAEVYEIELGTGKMEQLTHINKEIYYYMNFGKVDKRWVKTSDNKEMLTWVIYPPNFNPNKKYPVLLYCQGGPQSVVSQSWSYRWNFQLMAAEGYIVVAPNRRGLPSFGQEWLEQISGDYSGQNIRDLLSAIDDVSREPWADQLRMGCIGASYGGYSAFYLAGNHQRRFKAFIAHCGIFNLESMYGETEELFFVNNDFGGSYWDLNNKTAMRTYDNSPHKFVHQWNTPILITTGEYDYRIPYTQSLQAFTAARMMGIDARLISFENEAHQIFKPQNNLVWNREFFSWLDKHLR